MKLFIQYIFFFFVSVIYSQMPCSSGVSLNGADDFITLDDTDAINLQDTSDRTIEFWFKTSDINTKQVLYEEGGSVNAILIYLEAGRIYLGAYRDNGTDISDKRFFRSGSGDIEIDKWYHIAITLDNATTLKWFLNGTEQDSQGGLVVNTHSGSVTLGRNGDGLRFPSSLVNNWGASGGLNSETYNNALTGADSDADYYKGNISLFRIWNIARTDSEIDTNKSVFLTSGTDLVAYSDQDRIYYQPDGSTSISLTAFVSLNTQYTTIPNTDAINLQNTSDRTVEFRFKATDMNTRQVLYEEGGATNAITAYIEDGRFYFGVYKSNANTAANRRFFRSGDGNVLFNQWYHVAITLENATTLKWYLDGVEQDSQAGMVVSNHSGDINIGRSGGSILYPNDLVTGWTPAAPTTDPQTFSSGTNGDSGANNFSGDFDLFRIWNVARTQAEIDANKNTLLTSGSDLALYQSGTQMNYQTDINNPIDASEDAVGVITWDGSDSNDWATATNWIGDTAPDVTRKQKVAIPNETNDPIISTETSVGFLIVNAGVELVIETGATLNVYYGFDNNGTITVENGGSLIYHNCNSPITGSGTFNVIRDTRTYDEQKFYSYWSSPVIEADSNTATIFPDAQLIYTYDASTTDANWNLVGDVNMQPGIGYAIRNEGLGGEVRTFSGRINEGAIDLTLYFNTNEDEGEDGNAWSPGGDNLVGNPYPSAISWDVIIEDTDNQNINGTIYFWNQQSTANGDNSVSDYLQYNLTGFDDNGEANTELTGMIGTAQAFFLRTTDNTTIKLKPTHQIPGNNTAFYRSENNSEKKAGRSWVKISRGNKYKTLLIGFLEGATNGYDRLYDGPFDINETSLGFYSFVNDGEKVTIQGLPPLAHEEKILKLGFVIDEVAEHTISIQEEYIDEEYYIYLEDLELNTITDLRAQDYMFSVNAVGENNTRFRIVYSKQERTTLTLDEEVFNNEEFSVSVNNFKELILKHPQIELLEKLTIYNLLGAKILTFSKDKIKSVANLKTGIYLVSAVLEGNRKLLKKIVITK